jgi:hypothetical protein
MVPVKSLADVPKHKASDGVVQGNGVQLLCGNAQSASAGTLELHLARGQMPGVPAMGMAGFHSYYVK